MTETPKASRRRWQVLYGATLDQWVAWDSWTGTGQVCLSEAEADGLVATRNNPTSL